MREDGAGRVAVWNTRTEMWDWYSPTPDGEGYRLSGSTEALGPATTRYPTAAGAKSGNAGRIARRIVRLAVMRCNRCHRPMKGTTAYDGACDCGGLIEAVPDSTTEALGAKTAILAPDEGGKLVRRAPLKPAPVEEDADQEGAPEVTCPRCKGYGGVFPADEGESCNLCDGHGMVFDHGDGTYSNRTDRASYYW